MIGPPSSGSSIVYDIYMIIKMCCNKVILMKVGTGSVQILFGIVSYWQFSSSSFASLALGMWPVIAAYQRAVTVPDSGMEDARCVHNTLEIDDIIFSIALII